MPRYRFEAVALALVREPETQTESPSSEQDIADVSLEAQADYGLPARLPRGPWVVPLKTPRAAQGTMTPM